MGQIDAVDTSNNTYRITFDRQGLGTHSVPDYEVLVFKASHEKSSLYFTILLIPLYLSVERCCGYDFDIKFSPTLPTTSYSTATIIFLNIFDINTHSTTFNPSVGSIECRPCDSYHFTCFLNKCVPYFIFSSGFHESRRRSYFRRFSSSSFYVARYCFGHLSHACIDSNCKPYFL